MTGGPNILWVVTTQWRAQACGYAGDPNARTPRIDALAAESVNHVGAVTPHPFGPFARAALLTGSPSPENGVQDYFDPLPTEARTIAHRLGARGYATGFFGKWHLAPRDPAVSLVGEAHARMVVPRDRRGGFEWWEGFEGGFLLNDPFLHGDGWAEPTRVRGYQSDVVCERARLWMEGRRAPWFAMVSLEAPHPPYDAPSGQAKARRPEEIILRANVPEGTEVAAKARRELAGYYAHIEATDEAIGRLVAATSREETIVVFTSAHGDMHGSHGLLRKGWPHEESVRVPLLVRRPGVAPSQDAEAISLLDLPGMTEAWAAGRAEPARGEGSRVSMPSVVALPHQCDRVWRGVRTRTRKLVLNADGSPWLFFDLEHDPLERRNLARESEWATEIEALRRSV